jgi:hypothetical protein
MEVNRDALIEELRTQRDTAAREAEAAQNAELDPWGAGNATPSTPAEDGEALFRR